VFTLASLLAGLIFAVYIVSLEPTFFVGFGLIMAGLVVVDELVTNWGKQ
jgi:hypothetical protein